MKVKTIQCRFTAMYSTLLALGRRFICHVPLNLNSICSHNRLTPLRHYCIKNNRIKLVELPFDRSGDLRPKPIVSANQADPHT
jgi:hypothetical protein